MPFYRLRTSWVPSRSYHSKFHVSLNRLLLMIAEMFGISEGTVNNILKNGESAEIEEKFKPPLFNIWNLQKQDNNNGSPTPQPAGR